MPRKRGNGGKASVGKGTSNKGRKASRASPRKAELPVADPVRYAVVGLGFFAQAAVLPAFRHSPSSRLAALVTGDARKGKTLGRRHGVPAVAYDDYDDLLDSGDVDAVYIALPNDMHLDYALRAARKGIHVLTEKPMAMTSDDAEAMVAACHRHDVRLMVGYRLHFDPANLAAQEAIRGGRIGDPRLFASTFSYPVQPGNIRTQEERGGGPLHDIGIYCVNAARSLLRDEPTDAVAHSVRGTDPRFRDVDEAVCATLRFPGGRLASFACSFGAVSKAEYTVLGDKGSITLEHAYEFRSPMTLRVQSGPRTTTRQFPMGDQVAPELEHFAHCIRRGMEPGPSGEEGLADVRILEAIEEAARTGARVPIRIPRRTQRPSPRQARHEPPVRQPAFVRASEPHQD